MFLKKVILGILKVNCYMLTTDKAAVIIDPAIFNEDVLDFCNSNKGKEIAVLLTHCHCDHIMGAQKIRELTGAKIYIGKPDDIGLYNTEVSLSDRFHFKQTPFYADVVLENESEICFGDIVLKAIKTPGHTPGSVSFLLDDMLFSGDTLFFESFGRTDFPNGDNKVLKNSIDLLLDLPEDTVVYPGHGESTTISHEKEYNYYKRYL